MQPPQNESLHPYSSAPCSIGVRRAGITLAPLQQLQARITAVETTLMKRENVIRFLVVRLVLMLAMVVGFWAAMRQIA